MMPRQYLKFNGGAGKVHTLVTLGATHHGTTLSGIATLAEILGLLGCSSARQPPSRLAARSSWPR